MPVKQTTHDGIVAMCIYPQIIALRLAKVNDGGKHPMCSAVGSHTMKHIIGSVFIYPATTGDMGVCWFRPWHQGKGPHGASLFFTKIACAMLYITLESLLRRIVFRPLVGISRCLHNPTRIVAQS